MVNAGWKHGIGNIQKINEKGDVNKMKGLNINRMLLLKGNTFWGNTLKRQDLLMPFCSYHKKGI